MTLEIIFKSLYLERVLTNVRFGEHYESVFPLPTEKKISTGNGSDSVCRVKYLAMVIRETGERV